MLIKNTNADYKLMKARIIEKMGHIEESLKFYDESLDLKPLFSDALVDKGSALISLGRFDEAKELILQGIQLNPNCAIYYYNLGEVYSKLGDNESGLRANSRALELDPEDPYVYICQAKYLNESKNYLEALNFLNMAVLKFPNEGNLFYEKGESLYLLDREQEAIKEYNKSIFLNNRVEDSYFSIGNCYFEMEDFKNSKINYTIVAELDPTNENNKLYLALTFLKLEEIDNAEKLCLELTEMNIDNDEIKNKLLDLISQIKNKKQNNKSKALNDILPRNINSQINSNLEVANKNQFGENEIKNANYTNINELKIFNREIGNSHQNFNPMNLDTALFFYSKIYTKEIPIRESGNLKQELDEFFNSTMHLKQENIISYYGFQLFGNLLKLNMELSNYGSLNNLLNLGGQLSIKDKINISLDCARGLYYLHYNKITHGNIKSNNVMIFQTINKNQEIEYNSKLSDYGIGYKLERSGNIDSDFSLKNFRWRAPEYVKNDIVDFKSDIYSFGILLWEIFSLKVPFADYSLNSSQLIYKIANEKLRPNLNLLETQTPLWIKEIILRCWDDDVFSRPTSEEVFLYFKNI